MVQVLGPDVPAGLRGEDAQGEVADLEGGGRGEMRRGEVADVRGVEGLGLGRFCRWDGRFR